MPLLDSIEHDVIFIARTTLGFLPFEEDIDSRKPVGDLLSESDLDGHPNFSTPTPKGHPSAT